MAQLIKNQIQIEGLETNWALQMGTLNNKNIIQKYDISIKNDMVMHNNGKFVIVHQYDRNELTKNLFK